MNPPPFKHVWRASTIGTPDIAVRRSGFAPLDAELPGAGWPVGMLTELITRQAGIGELRLLVPVIRELTQAGKVVILLAPPLIPYAPALTSFGIDLDYLIIIQAANAADRLWAVEQTLKSASFGALLAWLPQRRTRGEHLRRMQLAAQTANGPVFLFRDLDAQFDTSPAPLRLLLLPRPNEQLLGADPQAARSGDGHAHAHRSTPPDRIHPAAYPHHPTPDRRTAEHHSCARRTRHTARTASRCSTEPGHRCPPVLWIALHLHRLSLDIIERAQVSTRPLAICDHLQILCCNQAARDAGVHPGMRRATAQALSPGIELMAHDPVRDRQALASLACWALQFTPSVGFAPPPLPERRALRARSRRAMTPADDPSSDHHAVPAPSTPGLAGLLLEVAASLRLFGGPDGLLALLQAGLTELGYHANVGIAPTCHGAWLLARSRPEGPHRQPGATDNDAQRLAREHALDIACNPDHLPERLSCLPISLLEQAQSQQTALQAIGARTIGQLLQLPRAGLARRFGKALLLELDAALGVQAPLIGFFQAPDRFATRIELMADVDRTEPLLFAARHLITELTGWLTARQAGVRSFDLILEHNTLPRTSLSVRLTDASRDPQRLLGLVA